MDTICIEKRWQTFLSIGLIVFLACLFYWPVLFEGKTQIHGDSILTGLPLMDLHSKALHGKASLLWTNLIYGGHPIFAEGQGAYAHPLNILFALLVPPVYGQNFFHWCCIILGSTGTFVLCRFFCLGHLSSLFGAISLGFSTLWLGIQSNMPISGSLSWVPWLIWAMEYWLKTPRLKSAIVFGTASALLVLAGYPQAFHGTLIYMIIRLLTVPFNTDARNEVIRKSKALIQWGGLSVLICIVLTAIQWLPLLELASLSHRSEGLPLLSIPPGYFWRGFIYSLISPQAQSTFYPGVGSLLVCVLASLSIFFRMPWGIKGHLIAGIFLIQLGIGRDSPVFSFFYDHRLIPGMHYFRVMMTYLSIAIVAIALGAAFSINSLSQIILESSNTDIPDTQRGPIFHTKIILKKKTITGLVIFAIFWMIVIFSLHMHEISFLHYVTLFSALFGIIILLFKRSRYIPIFLTALLTFECIALRLNQFHFADSQILAKPEIIDKIQKNSAELYRSINMLPSSTGYGFVHPLSNHIEHDFKRMLASNTAMTNIFWNIPSYDGALALSLHRRALINDRIISEINKKKQGESGFRMIDILGIRFITVKAPVDRDAFRVFFQDEELGITVMENTAAWPKFQAYTEYLFADSPDQALRLLEKTEKRVIVIENGYGSDMTGNFPMMRDNETYIDDNAIDFQIKISSPEEYVLKVNAENSWWLYIADANYPGWRGYLDNKEVPVFNAQVLGKAVQVPKGRHTVRFFYKSFTYNLGYAISMIGVILTIFVIFLIQIKYKHAIKSLPLSGDKG